MRKVAGRQQARQFVISEGSLRHSRNDYYGSTTKPLLSLSKGRKDAKARKERTKRK
jgi:hypothetical protein